MTVKTGLIGPGRIADDVLVPAIAQVDAAVLFNRRCR